MNKSGFIKLLLAAVPIVALLISFKVYAFKVDTHVWVGQQVINDLEDDGQLTINIAGVDYYVTPDPVVRDAILANKNIYRMGNIGPDAFPDIFTGQSVVHPGIDKPGGWKTDNWLHWLLSDSDTPEKKAFAYGYLSHAAADTFAHSYVNFYSGGAFDLFDHELDVEERHIYLETFITNHRPPIKDNTGTDLGNAADIVDTPSLYLRDKLIMNDTVANQYRMTMMKHLPFIYDLKVELQRIIDEDMPKYEAAYVNHVIFEGSEGAGYASAGVSASGYDKEILGREHKVTEDDIRLARDYNEKYHLSLEHELSNQAVDEIQTINDTLTAQLIEGISNGADLANKVNKGWNDLKYSSNTLLTALDQIDSWANELAGINKYVQEWACLDWIDLPWPADGYCLNNVYGWVDTDVINSEWTRLTNEISNLTTTVNDVYQPAYNRYNQEQKQTVQDAVTLYIAAISAKQAAVNGVIDTIQVFENDRDPLYSFLLNWVNDIDLAMAAWVDTNANAIRATMSHGDALGIYMDWFDCWLPVVGGIPAQTAGAVCSVRNHLNDIKATIQSIQTRVDKLNPVYHILEKIKAKVEEKAMEALVEFLSRQSGTDLARVLKWLLQDVTDDVLNTTFSTDLGNTGLITIADVAQRVKSEMNLSNGIFDPDKYTVVKNAILLSKLSLLNGEQLNGLLIQANLTNKGIYTQGNPIYTEGLGSLSNILIGTLGSIDGNHQWRHHAPPYPRRPGYELVRNISEKQKYGYLYHKEQGMRLWQDPEARSMIFDNLFTGPVSPALETPIVFGFASVLPTTYIYGGCETNPFPLSNYDARCQGGEKDTDSLPDNWEQQYLKNLASDPEDDNDNDGLTNEREYELGTDPLNEDSDSDGIQDGKDGPNGSHALVADVDGDGIIDGMNDTDHDGVIDSVELSIGTLIDVADTDGDGLSDLIEIQAGTDPNSIDTDGDGLSDQVEINLGLDPTVSVEYADTDEDGLLDIDEINIYGSNPVVKDSDGDGLDDGLEVTIGFKPDTQDSNGDAVLDGNEDIDGDGLSNLEELASFTKINNPDSDSDGLSDGVEVSIGTNPNLKDSDFDGIPDAYENSRSDLNPKDGFDGLKDDDGDGLRNYQEYQYGTDFYLMDTDGDLLSDYDEVMIYKTNPLKKDTDGDGVNDKDEIDAGTDPNLNIPALITIINSVLLN